MIKNLISKMFIVSFCLIFTNNLYAAANVKGAATQLVVTMTKVELCESGSTISNCLNPIDITKGSGASADIAAVAAGETAATVADFSKAILGKSYTHIQTVMSRAMTITGKAGTGGKCTTIAGTNGKCRTRAGINGSLSSAGAVGALSSSGSPGSATLYVPFFSANANYTMMEGSDADGANLAPNSSVRAADTHFRSRNALTNTYTPVAGSSPTVFVAFDTSIAVNELDDSSCTNAGLQAAPPTVTITVQGQ